MNKSLAQIGYEAWAAKTEETGLADEQVLWDDLHETEREAWVCAAGAISGEVHAFIYQQARAKEAADRATRGAT